MYTIATVRSTRKSRFDAVAEPFLQQPGLPFAEALTAEAIERAFAENDSLFGQRDIFSTPIVLWAFLAQVLRGGKGGACAAAVSDIATYMQQTGGPVPSGDTGDWSLVFCQRADTGRFGVRPRVFIRWPRTAGPGPVTTVIPTAS